MVISKVLRGGTALALVLALCACAVTPEPMTRDEVKSRIASDQARLFSEAQTPKAPISLAEAMARAIKYNLDHRMKVMETALAHGEADATRWDLLPRIAANAGYTSRTNEAGAKSKSLLTNNDSLEYSTSAEREYATASLQTAWNVLDFGVSYLRSKQAADGVLVVEETRRAQVHQIIQDVRYAFWRAASAQRLLPKVDALEKQVDAALTSSRAAESRGLETPEKALEYQQTLLETMRDIGAIKRDLVLARTELSALMNLSPGTTYTVADPGTMIQPKLTQSLQTLQELALYNRPELREQDYMHRISVAEVNKTILRMLPGLELNTDLQWSGNKYLFNDGWAEAGLKLTWNLMSVLSGPERIHMAEAREEHTVLKRLGISMAVLTQVNVSWLRQQQTAEEFRLSQELLDVTNRLEARTNNAAALKAESGLATIHRASKTVAVELRRDSAYAELQNAAGRIYATIGADPLPRRMLDNDLDSVTQEIAKALTAWDAGTLDMSLETAPDQYVRTTPPAIVAQPAAPTAAEPVASEPPAVAAPVAQAPTAVDTTAPENAGAPSTLEKWIDEVIGASPADTAAPAPVMPGQTAMAAPASRP